MKAEIKNCIAQIWSKRTCALVMIAFWVVSSSFGWMMLHPRAHSKLNPKTFYAAFTGAEVLYYFHA